MSYVKYFENNQVLLEANKYDFTFVWVNLSFAHGLKIKYKLKCTIIFQYRIESLEYIQNTIISEGPPVSLTCYCYRSWGSGLCDCWWADCLDGSNWNHFRSFPGPVSLKTRIASGVKECFKDLLTHSISWISAPT